MPDIKKNRNTLLRAAFLAPLVFCCTLLGAGCRPPHQAALPAVPTPPPPPVSALAGIMPTAPDTPVGLPVPDSVLPPSPPVPVSKPLISKPLKRQVRYRISRLKAAIDYDADDASVVLNSHGDLLNSTEVWRQGKKQTLPNPTKDQMYCIVEASGMNDEGTVAGSISEDQDGAYILKFSRAVKWQRGKMKALPTFERLETVAAGINSKGEIVGYGFEQTNDALADTDRAFLFRRGRMEDIGRGEAVCINDSSQVIVKWSDPSTFRFYAKDKGQAVGTAESDVFLWKHGTRRPLVVALGCGDFDTFAGFNNRGQLAGQISTGRLSRYFSSNVISRAYVWHNGRTRVLETLGGESSKAVGINNRGQVVGKADVGPPDAQGNENTHAFIWHGGRMSDLNRFVSARSGWTLYTANAINDRGQIVGTGNKGTFLLTPIAAKRH